MSERWIVASRIKDSNGRWHFYALTTSMIAALEIRDRNFLYVASQSNGARSTAIVFSFDAPQKGAQ